MTARREIGKWLNELPNRDVDRATLAELCADYDALHAALRWHIRVYRVADEAWEPEAETDRIMKLALSGLHNAKISNERSESALNAVLGIPTTER